MVFLGLIIGAVLVAGHSAAAENITLEFLNSISFNSFLRLFRQAVVTKLANEWNTTLYQSNDLKVKTDACNNTVLDQDRRCQACAKDCHALNNYTIEFTNYEQMNKEAFTGIKEGVFAAKHGFTDDGRYISNTASQPDNNTTDNPMAYNITDILERNISRMDTSTSQCVGKCSECIPLTLGTQEQIISSLCGDDVANKTRDFITKVDKLRTVYDIVVDKVQPIMSQIELDQSSMNYSLGYSYTVVYITVNIKGQYHRYRTQKLFSNMYQTETATNMTLKYWNKYDLE